MIIFLIYFVRNDRACWILPILRKFAGFWLPKRGKLKVFGQKGSDIVAGAIDIDRATSLVITIVSIVTSCIDLTVCKLRKSMCKASQGASAPYFFGERFRSSFDDEAKQNVTFRGCRRHFVRAVVCHLRRCRKRA